jgi:transposase-like protein
MPKSKLSRDQWLALVAEYAQSGFNVAEFCAAKDVSAQSFYRKRTERSGAFFVGRRRVWPALHDESATRVA